MARVTAILGPTNTGKTHAAIEAMISHDSGVLGLPLRLLAREVYERLKAQVGVDVAALVTGEEKIVPPGARYFACTTEAMPAAWGTDRTSAGWPFAFVGVDEVQLCTDRERGHVFTDRVLHRRGTHETMFLGADTMAGVLPILCPDVVIERRPRLSRLRYAGSKKLARLPPRSAVVAFSIKEVYALAEALRVHRGGAAVVTGALSPATRNAQVAMFQRGEVDVLVATDAIGMGLNLDIEHVAFSADRKFDGEDVRPLTDVELAQIAGRAGRHLRHGTFGVTDGQPGFAPALVERLEQHRFDRVERVVWRNSDLDTSSLASLHASLCAPPTALSSVRSEQAMVLGFGRRASDLLALERLRQHDDVVATVRSAGDVAAFFAVCQIPDFARLSPEDHTGLILEVWRMVSSGRGVDGDWLGKRLAQLGSDEVVASADVETLVARLAHVRSLTYIAHHPGWVRDAAHWQQETRVVEDRLSDALHQGLTSRFVDKLQRVLVGGGRLDADVDDDGVVHVAGERLGQLAGLRFALGDDDGGSGDQSGRDKLRALAAARSLQGEITARIEALLAVDDDDKGFTLVPEQLAIAWQGDVVGRLLPGRTRSAPRVRPLVDGPVGDDAAVMRALTDKLQRVARVLIQRGLPILSAIDVDALPQKARAFGHALHEGLGIASRQAVEAKAGPPDDEARKALRKKRVRLGFHDVYVDDAFKQAAITVRGVLLAVWREQERLPTLPPAGASSFLIGDRPEGFVRGLGFVVVDGPRGLRAFRGDLVDDVLVQLKQLPLPLPMPASVVERWGCTRDEAAAVLRTLGFDVDDEGRLSRARRSRGRRPSLKRSASPAR